MSRFTPCVVCPSILEAISKIEKWFEVKPPAPLPARRAYRPEGRAYAPEGTAPDLKNPDHRSGLLLMKKLLGFFK